MADAEKSAVIITSTAGPGVACSLCRDTRLGSAYSSLLWGVSLKYLGGGHLHHVSVPSWGLSLSGPPPVAAAHLGVIGRCGCLQWGFCLASKASCVTCWVRGSPPHIRKASYSSSSSLTDWFFTSGEDAHLAAAAHLHYTGGSGCWWWDQFGQTKCGYISFLK